MLVVIMFMLTLLLIATHSERYFLINSDMDHQPQCLGIFEGY